MATNDNLLVPAAQKLYSALSSLERFSKHNDFFDNISSLDSFLSEYRNVTFVIQKSLAHTNLLSIYEETRDEFLSGDLGKWFVEKRNEVLKEHPFKLQKVVKVTIYDSLSTLKITSQKFTAEDDADYSSLIEDVRLLLKDNGRIETSFSVEFIYKEFESEANLFDKLLPGVSNIYKFLCALNQKIGDNSKLFHDIMNKVGKLNILKVNRTGLFVEDYVYYSSNDNFERGSRIELRLPKCRIPENKMFGMLDELGGDISLDNLGINPIDDIHKLFLKIIIWYAFLYSHQNNHIMSTIILVYDDNTCEIQSPFDTTIRTTAYRKINEVADCIIQSKDPEKAVIVINEMWSYPNNGEVLAKNYEERVKTENPISLFACHMVDKCLNSYSYHFESDKVGSLSYVIDILKQDIDATIHMNFMNPVIKAFQSRLQI